MGSDQNECDKTFELSLCIILLIQFMIIIPKIVDYIFII